MVATQTAFHIGPASRAHATAIAALLARCALPRGDIEGHLRHFHVVTRAGEVVGTVGVEIYEELGLLRSLALSEEVRGQGLGKGLAERAESYARSQGVATLYLLTETATGFFARRGFVQISRESAPDSIRQTSEFASLCPAGATCMVKNLAQR